MKFHEQLNEYLNRLDCTAKALSQSSGLSAATLSRYRAGERVPERGSDALEKLSAAIAQAAERCGKPELTRESVLESFLRCQDVAGTDRGLLRRNFNTLVSILNINLSRLCRQINYDTSTIFRIRNGTRQPAEPEKFASGIAAYVTRELDSESELEILAQLFGCPVEELRDGAVRFERIRSWLTEGEARRDDSIPGFLAKLNEFDLNEYIKAIHFDEMKLPTVPFQLPTSKSYFGLKQMKDSELDFLKATVLSRSMSPVIMYSDMPMQEMSKDAEFSKKWMFGMAMMLKKGLHLNMIHNVDRPFSEMMLGLESYIPMYMTGQITPYYLKGVQNGAFLHLLKTSGSAALAGEAISGHHEEGRYYMTKNKEEVAYYSRRAQALLENATPLMQIYRAEHAKSLNAFLLADAHTPGRRRSIRSVPPAYTMDEAYLNAFLRARSVSDRERQQILDYAAKQRQLAQEIMKNGSIFDELPCLSAEEFAAQTMTLDIAGLFSEADLRYTYEDYLAHLEQTECFATRHAGYRFEQTTGQTFCNLQILMHEGQWVMISKGKAPAIHFVIHHPKMREAIENFVPPMVESAE